MASFGQIGNFVKRTAGFMGITPMTRNNLGVNVPDGLLMMIDATKEGDYGTAAQNFGEALEDISVASQFLYCFGEMVANPAMFGSMLTGMASNLCGTMAQVMNTITDALMYQVGLAIDGVIGSVSRAINAVIDLINSVLDLINVIVNLPKLIAQLASANWLNWKKVERCDEIVAAILACLLNKLLGDPIQTFQNKIVSKINEYGYNINQAISDEFYDLNVLTAYVEQEAFFLNKANYQMEGLYADFGVVIDPAKVARESAAKQNSDVKINEDGSVSVKGTNTKTSTKGKNGVANTVEVKVSSEEEEDDGKVHDEEELRHFDANEIVNEVQDNTYRAMVEEEERLKKTDPIHAIPAPANHDVPSPFGSSIETINLDIPTF